MGTQAPKVCVLVEDVVLDGPAGYGANDAADHGVQGGDVGFAAVHCVPDSTTSEYAGVDFVEASCHGCNHEQRATNGPGVLSREQDNHEECRANRCGTECEHVTAQDAEVKLYVAGRVEASYSVDMGLAGFGEALVLLEWSKPAAGLATLRITADPALAVEDERNRADNSFSLSLDIAAAPSGNGDSSGDGDGFSIPGFGLAGALLSAAIVARCRR